MALLRTLKELQLELLLQVAERLINVLVPPIHEPRCPNVRSLELVEIPTKHLTNFVLLCYYLVDGHWIISRLRETFDVWWVDLFELGSHVQACHTYKLKVTSWNVLSTIVDVVVNVLYWKVEGLPLKAVVWCNLADPVE